MRYVYFFIIGIVCAVTMSGCVGAIVGGAAVGTYAITQDFVTTSVDADFSKAWKVANDQLNEIGEVDDEQQKLGEIRAVVEGATVKVTIAKLTDQTVDITVAARSGVVPKTDLARAILSSILRRL